MMLGKARKSYDIMFLKVLCVSTLENTLTKQKKKHQNGPRPNLAPLHVSTITHPLKTAYTIA